jgi:hypothetical protein
MTIPQYLILDASEHLQNLRESLCLAAENDCSHPSEFSPSLIESVIDDYVDNLIICIERRDTAVENLRDYCNALFQREHQCETERYKVTEHVYWLGMHLYETALSIGAYFAEDFIPYAYFGRIGTDSIILMRVNQDDIRTGLLQLLTKPSDCGIAPTCASRFQISSVFGG